MGPRPDGRGRFDLADDDALDYLLQWGRGRMAAEGRPHDLDKTGFPMLQWGRGRMAAEGTIPPSRRRPGPGFNGAAAGWPRKAWHGQGANTALTCFNGAAAGWPRKVDFPILAISYR